MKFQKTIIFQLTKCYSLAPLQYHGESCFLVGAEKHDPSYLFHADGTVLAKVWDAPGGVMTMEQLPGTDGQFLSTQEFYSPNNGKNARIVIAVPTEDRWDVRTLVDIPLVHRFGILSRGGVNYLLVCTIKNDYSERDDWRQPGTVYAAVLPDDLSCFDAQHQLPLQPIMTGLWKNHGFSKYSDGGIQTALIGAQQGLFQFTPPAAPGESWNIRQLLDVPCSDAVMTDFDGDGLAEIGCMTPFHGDALQIFHKQADGTFAVCWRMPYRLEMLHATWLCHLNGRPVWVVGCRGGVRQTLALYCENGMYQTQIIDADAGAANALQISDNTLVCTNHAINEVALYTVCC